MKKIILHVTIYGIVFVNLLIRIPTLINSFNSGYEYIAANGKSAIVCYRGVEDHITIPNTLGGMDVTELISLDYNRFDSTVSYNNDCLYKCREIVSITIPQGITNIWINQFFVNCTKLEYIEVDPLNPMYMSVDGLLYSKDGGVLLYYPQGRKESSLLIPQGPSKIGDYAFAHCDKLAYLTIPSSVTEIGWYAFLGCTNLTNVNMSFGVERVGRGAFAACVALTNICIPGSVLSIVESAFEGAKNLQHIIIPSTVCHIGYKAFDKCPNLVIYGVRDTEAETYAKKNRITFISIEADQTTY